MVAVGGTFPIFEFDWSTTLNKGRLDSNLQQFLEKNMYPSTVAPFLSNK
jgi:hypothetical protein